MRSITGPELTLLEGQRQNDYLRLEIKNASGTWKDFASLAGKDYVVGVTLSTDVDSPVWSMQAQLKRDGEVATESLAPLRSDSSLNVDDASAYAPAINAAREWRVTTAVTAAGVAPSGPDWKELCAGFLDKPDFAADPMSIEGRSVGARLMDQTIRTKRTYSGTLADVAQQIVDDNVPTPAPTLYIPVAPSFTVTDYTPYQVSVMDALVTLALSTGWMVRDVYDPSDSTMKTAIIDPNRAKASADATLSPMVYLTVDGASLDVSNVRNYIEGEAIDAETGGLITTFAIDPASIAAFGGVERYMKFSEDATSPINSFNELQAMVDAALADLSTPKFDHVVTSTFFWPAEIADLYDFLGNAVHYDQTQRLGVFGISHSFANGHATTTLTCRGTPAGAFLEWIRRQGPGPETPAVPPAPQVDFVVGEADSYGADEADDESGYDGGLWVQGRFNEGCAEIAIYAELADGEGFSVDQTSSTEANARLRRPDGVEGSDPNFQFFVRLTTRAGFYKRLTFIGFSGLGRPSKELVWPFAVQAIDPIPTPEDGTIASISIAADPLQRDYAVTVTPASLDTTLTENWLVITRNGQTVFRLMIGTSLAPVTFLDTGLDPRNTYQWDAFIWNNGVSGPKNRFVEPVPPKIGDAPQWTVRPTARYVGDVIQIYMEGVSNLAGADRMQVQKSLDQSNTTSFALSAYTPGDTYFAFDTDTAMKWYRLVAWSSADPDVFAVSDWAWWPGLPPLDSQGPNPPVFTKGTPKREMSGGGGGTVPIPVLFIAWTCATSGATQMSIQTSNDNGLTDPWTEIERNASVTSGEYRNFSLVTDDAWYRLVALSPAGAAISFSAGAHYIP